MRHSIFISHRSTDAVIVEMIKDFLVATGIPNEKIFCSSLPGNDVNEKISPEVKQRLKEASIIILILSNDFYHSAYCLNEAGIAWYLDDVVSIPIGMPEINHNNLVGFLNSDYKLRRLDSFDDISYLYDTAHDCLNSDTVKVGVITRETQKLIERYKAYIEGREIEEIQNSSGEKDKQAVKVTYDACLLLMYAFSDPGGQIMFIRFMGGADITSAGFSFIKDCSPKEIARWKGALEELEQYGLVQAANYKREVFKLTREGFDAAEQLKKSNHQIDTKVDPREYLMPYESEDNIQLLADVVLLFATELNGIIDVDKSVHGITYVVGGKFNLNASQNSKEIAKWDAVLELLLAKKLIEKDSVKESHTFYKVKHEGYVQSKGFKETNQIDITDKTPKKVIKEFVEDL